MDALAITRNLKSHNVKVIFEKENLDTFDPNSEMMLTIMSAIAQKESHNISMNVIWDNRKSMKDGNVSIPYAIFLGYRKGENGRPEIVVEEAIIVRDIYDLFTAIGITAAQNRHSAYFAQ